MEQQERKQEYVGNEIFPDCSDGASSSGLVGWQTGKKTSLLTWAQFVPTSLLEVLERNKPDQWVMSTPTHASLLRQFSSTYPLQKTSQHSQTASIIAQWRGSYLHFLIRTSSVLLYFRYLLPSMCQIPLSLIYMLKPNTFSKVVYGVWPLLLLKFDHKHGFYGFYLHLWDPIN